MGVTATPLREVDGYGGRYGVIWSYVVLHPVIYGTYIKHLCIYVCIYWDTWNSGACRHSSKGRFFGKGGKVGSIVKLKAR